MGITPSRTSLYLPSETLRVCNLDHCWCNTSHGRRTSKYIYVERGGDGRERYQDPVDMIAEYMMGAGNGGGMNLPWKSPSEWSVRDFERLGEVLNEFHMRERGRLGGSSGGGVTGGGRGGYPPAMPWDDFNGQVGGGGSAGRRRRTYPSWGEFERMQMSFEDRFRRMAEEHERHLAERDAMLFGSHEDRRREQYQRNMLKTLQDIMPQLAQMIAAQQMMGGPGGVAGGVVPPMAMPMAAAMPQSMGGALLSGMGAVGHQAGMAGMHPGMVGVGGLDTAMPGFPNLGGQAGPAMGGYGMGGGGMNSMGGGFGRRGRGRRARFAKRDDFDDEFDGLGGGRGGRGFERGAGQWDNEDDAFGRGFRGDGGSLPRRPGPRRPDGNLDGGGRTIDADGFVPKQHQNPSLSPPRPSEAQAGLNGSTDFGRHARLDEILATMPDGDLPPATAGMQNPPLTPPVCLPRMPHAYPSARPYDRPLRYDSTLPPTYTSGPVDGLPPIPDFETRGRFANASTPQQGSEAVGRRGPDVAIAQTGGDL